MHRVVVVVVTDYCSVLYIESFKREKRCVLGGIYLFIFLCILLSLFIYIIYIYIYIYIYMYVCVYRKKRDSVTLSFYLSNLVYLSIYL